MLGTVLKELREGTGDKHGATVSCKEEEEYIVSII